MTVQACNEFVGVYTTSVDAIGGFQLRLVHAGELGGAPLPPDTAGYFSLLGCEVTVMRHRGAVDEVMLALDSVAVRFGRPGVPEPVTWIELREP